MNARALSLVGFATVVAAAGVAFAMVGSMLESRYGGALDDIAIAQEGLNDLRITIDGATTNDIVAGRDEADRLINKVAPSNFSLVRSAFREQEQGREFSTTTLLPEQARELLGVIAIYMPEDAKRIGDTNMMTAGDFFRAVDLCAAAVEGQGRLFLVAVNSPEPVGSNVQIERAVLSLELARFDILLAYFTILVEKTG